MIGDAPGDFKAAKSNHALFYPIVPGREEESWQRFYEEALERFFAGTIHSFCARLLRERPVEAGRPRSG
jgi:superfamily I DNA/RNA helicase